MKFAQCTKRSIKFVFIIYACSICFSCQQKKEQAGIRTLYIDIPTSKHSIDSLFSKIELIRIDTINDGIISFVSSIEYMNNTIYIKQMSTNEVFSYDSCGRFNFKISDNGGGPQEYNSMADFIINPLNSTLLILDHADYHQYDTLGNYIKHVNIDTKGNGRISAIVPHTLDKYICVLDLKWSTNYELFSIDDKPTIPIFSDHLPINVTSPFYLFNNQLYHYKWYDNTVYKVGNDALLTPHYTLDFTDGVNITIPSSITNDDEFTDIIINKGVCFDQIQENDKYILIGIVQTIDNEPKRETIIYDKVRKQTYNVYNFDENFSVGSNLILTEDNYLIGVVNTADLKSAIDIELLGSKSRHIYNNITENDNPIIVKCKLQ